jgi:Ca2+-binding EF-hand superfamily protein
MAKVCSWLLAFVLILSLGSGVALAKGKGGKKGGGKRAKQTIDQLFNEFDKDKDGKLSKTEFADMKAEEARQRAGQMFTKLDTNHDGSLTLDELKAATAGKGGGNRAGKK